jgi:hypothetical protein
MLPAKSEIPPKTRQSVQVSSLGGTLATAERKWPGVVFDLLFGQFLSQKEEFSSWVKLIGFQQVDDCRLQRRDLTLHFGDLGLQEGFLVGSDAAVLHFLVCLFEFLCQTTNVIRIMERAPCETCVEDKRDQNRNVALRGSSRGRNNTTQRRCPSLPFKGHGLDHERALKSDESSFHMIHCVS